MATHHSPVHLEPYEDRGDLVAQAARHGASPLLVVIALLLVAALIWVVR